MGISLTGNSTHPHGKARVAGPARRRINQSTATPLPNRGDRSRREHVVLRKPELAIEMIPKLTVAQLMYRAKEDGPALLGWKHPWDH